MTQKPGWTGSLLAPILLAAIGWVYGGALAARDRAAVQTRQTVASANR
jgi:hypothetical protein